LVGQIEEFCSPLVTDRGDKPSKRKRLMSKKLTFKSVAISAVLALGLTGIVGVSASAAPAGTVTLAPTTGTEYFVTADYQAEFNLRSSNTADAIGTTGLLKWKIVAPATADEAIKVKDSTLGSLTSEGTKHTATNVADSAVGGPAGVWYQNDNTVSLFLGAASTKVAVGSEIRVLRYTSTRIGSNTANDDDVTSERYPAGSASDAAATETVRVLSVASGLVTYQTSFAQDTVSSNAPGDLGAGSSVRWGTYYEIDFGNATGNTYSTVSGERVLIVSSRHNAASFNKNLVLQQTDNASATSDDTRRVEVTAWVDINGDGVIDADEETVSPTRTVTFINRAEVVLATDGFTFAGPVAGQTTVTSSIKTEPVLNHEQSLLVPRTLFTTLANTNVLASPTRYWGGSARSSADASVITSTSDTQGAFKAGVYTARPFLTESGSASNTDSATYSTNDVDKNVALAAAVTRTIAADRVYDIIATVAGSNNTSPVETYTSATSYVRLGTASATVTAVAVSDSDDTPVGAGKTVVATISSSAFKINDVAGPVTLTTNASGQVSVTISKTAPASAGSVTVTFTSTDVAGTNVDASIVLDWVAASYELFNLNDTDTTGVVNNLSVAAGKSVSFAYAIHDQWKVPAPTATYRVDAAISGTGVSTTSSGALSWSGNVANLTVTNNGTVGSAVISVVATAKTGASFATTFDTETTSIDVVSASQSFKAELWAGTSDYGPRDNIQYTKKVVSFDPRVSQLARPSYESDGVIEVGVIVRETNTGLVRPYAKVTISGPADFLFTASDSVDRLGSTSAVANGSGIVTFGILSNRSVTDAVVRITTEDGTGESVEVSFRAPGQKWARGIEFNTPKSIKAGRTITGTIAVVDRWGNAVKEDDDLGDQSVRLTSSRGFVGLVQPTESNISVYQAKVMLQPMDRGPVVLEFTWQDTSPPTAFETLRASTAVWAGPAVNATAGAKKGRVVIESYRAKGKTVNVFVGSTRVATFTPKKANDRFVVKGIKSGNRKVTARIAGPSYDFKGTVTVK
jgi:hypothetical protein